MTVRIWWADSDIERGCCCCLPSLCCALQAGGRRLLKDEDEEPKPKAVAKGKPTAAKANKRGKPEPRTIVPGQKMYMVVGFEVVACSIKRTPGEPINKNLICPQTPDDANAPEPQEVKKGERLAGVSAGLAV